MWTDIIIVLKIISLEKVHALTKPISERILFIKSRISQLINNNHKITIKDCDVNILVNKYKYLKI